MLAYFDIENLSSFVSSSASSKFADCNRMLRRHFDIHFNFPKEELKKHPDILSWIKVMNDGILGEDPVFSTTVFPPRPLKSNTHKDFDLAQLSAVYLLNDDRMGMLMNNGLIMYSEVGTEVEVLSSLIRDDVDYGFVKQLEVKKMKNWDNLDSHMTPATDVIIVDQYLFSDNSIYENNAYTLIAKVCQRIRNAQANIVFFTPPDFYNRTTKNTFTPNWGIIKSSIKQKVKSVTGQDPKITFVFSRNLEEHDRTIFTNYQYLVSGDSFNYFDSQWRIITNGRYLNLHSVAHRAHYTTAMNFIADMQVILDDVKRLNSDNIKYDKESYYLKF